MPIVIALLIAALVFICARAYLRNRAELRDDPIGSEYESNPSDNGNPPRSVP